MFLALEQVMALFRRRRQATLLKQIKPAVEGMCGRSFTRQHLAQIAFVQPGEHAARVYRPQVTPYGTLGHSPTGRQHVLIGYK